MAAALADRVLYYTPVTEEQPSIATAAIVTALDPENGETLFLMGNLVLGFAIAKPAPEPTPGFYTEFS